MDSNLRPLRPERSDYFLHYRIYSRRRALPPRFVHGRFTQFVAISLRRSQGRSKPQQGHQALSGGGPVPLRMDTQTLGGGPISKWR
jgi:hypothetical protein